MLLRGNILYEIIIIFWAKQDKSSQRFVDFFFFKCEFYYEYYVIKVIKDWWQHSNLPFRKYNSHAVPRMVHSG